MLEQAQNFARLFADVAQLVERHIRNVQATSSILVIGSDKLPCGQFLFCKIWVWIKLVA